MLAPCSAQSVYPGTSGTKLTLGGPGCWLPSLPQAPTRPTSSPDVYTGWSGPLPAWDRLNKHTQQLGSFCLQLPTDGSPPRLVFHRRLRPTPDPLFTDSPLQIILRFTMSS